MKYVIELELEDRLDHFSEYQRKRILHYVFGFAHDGYAEWISDAKNYADTEMAFEQEGMSHENAVAATAAVRFLEVRLEAQLFEEAGKNDA